ncbi:palmitoyltransferase for Vac8p [Tulasnella sp. 403]|nr:palmitoyltransferase for Vac8p [Tulasnella sp. 403]
MERAHARNIGQLTYRPSVLVNWYLLQANALAWFLVHLGVIYTLSFIALTSFMIVLVRDPGPVDGVKAQKLEDAVFGHEINVVEGDDDDGSDENEGEIALSDALMKGPKIINGVANQPWSGNGERRWCQKCWSPKPERCAKCIGHRTYPPFVHLLLPIRHYLFTYVVINDGDWTPYHVLFVAIMGFIFSLTIGSFWGYHVYLISTNQTTLEQLAPFLLLRHIPPLPNPSDTEQDAASPIQFAPPSSSALAPSPSRERPKPGSPYFFPSPPPNRTKFPQSVHSSTSSLSTQHNNRLKEHMLSGAQRRRVRKGDGYTFEFNPKAERQLARLATDLANL